MRKGLILALLALGLTLSAPVAAQNASPAAKAAANAEAVTKQSVDELKNAFAGLQSAFNDMIAATQVMAEKIGRGQSPVVLSTNQIVGIALGATGGALLVDFLGGGGLATIGGAVFGGAAAHWLMSPVEATSPVAAALPSKSG